MQKYEKYLKSKKSSEGLYELLLQSYEQFMFFEIWLNFKTMDLVGKRHTNKFGNFRPITYSENG